MLLRAGAEPLSLDVTKYQSALEKDGLTRTLRMRFKEKKKFLFPLLDCTALVHLGFILLNYCYFGSFGRCYFVVLARSCSMVGSDVSCGQD